LVGQADFAEQRLEAVDLSSLRGAGTPAGDVVDVPKDLLQRRFVWAHDKGVPAKIVAQLMGHAKVDTTLNVYTQVLDDSVRAAAGKVGSELFTIVHQPGRASQLTH
jgi:hypothetical protein